jgi:hypothetical protein
MAAKLHRTAKRRRSGSGWRLADDLEHRHISALPIADRHPTLGDHPSLPTGCLLLNKQVDEFHSYRLSGHLGSVLTEAKGIVDHMCAGHYVRPVYQKPGSHSQLVVAKHTNQPWPTVLVGQPVSAS